MDDVKLFILGWKDVLSAIQSASTIAALIVGGFWAYFKVFRGRTYTDRLEPSIEGNTIQYNQVECLIIRVRVKNIGLARVWIDLDDSSIILESYTEDSYLSEFHNAIWSHLGTISGLEHHGWIEPSETITEERLVALPNSNMIAIKLRLRLLPRVRCFCRSRTEWNAVTVFSRKPPLSMGNNQTLSGDAR